MLNVALYIFFRLLLLLPSATLPARPPACSIGNLPGGVTEGELRQAVNEMMVGAYATAAPGFPITSCKLYQVGVPREGAGWASVRGGGSRVNSRSDEQCFPWCEGGATAKASWLHVLRVCKGCGRAASRRACCSWQRLRRSLRACMGCCIVHPRSHDS